jgi:protein-tyrosine phosphatase
MNNPNLRVLLVCMGNICRSPTAEAVLRAKLRAAGLHDRIEVDSAGTHNFHPGSPPDLRAQKHAAKRGYDLASLRARQVKLQDFETFDVILAMDDDNLDGLAELCPASARDRVGLLMAHARKSAQRTVPDPYYGGPGGFEEVLDLVEDACEGLVDQLRQRLIEPAAGRG